MAITTAWLRTATSSLSFFKAPPASGTGGLLQPREPLQLGVQLPTIRLALAELNSCPHSRSMTLPDYRKREATQFDFLSSQNGLSRRPPASTAWRPEGEFPRLRAGHERNIGTRSEKILDFDSPGGGIKCLIAKNGQNLLLRGIVRCALAGGEPGPAARGGWQPLRTNPLRRADGRARYAQDPRRPDHVPWPPKAEAAAAGRGILAFAYQVSDDGQWALVELVARDRKALEPVLSDRRPSVKVFERGKARAAEIQAEFRKYKRDFELDRFQANLP